MRDNMTETDLAAIRARCEAATPGPWKVVKASRLTDRWGAVWGHVGVETDFQCNRSDQAIFYSQGHCSPANAAFIAHAREDIPALLAALDARDAEIARLKKELKSIAKSAKLNSDPGSAHSCQISFGELLSSFRWIARHAEIVLEGGTIEDVVAEMDNAEYT